MKRILTFIISIVFTMSFIIGCSMNKATLKEIAKYKKEILLKNNQNTYKESRVLEDITYKLVDGQELKLYIYMGNVIDYKKRLTIVYVHGEKDTIVPISQSRALYEKAKSFGIDVELVAVKNDSHGLISIAGEIGSVAK